MSRTLSLEVAKNARNCLEWVTQHRGPQEGGCLRSPRRAQFAEGTEAPSGASSGPGSALTAASAGLGRGTSQPTRASVSRS